MQRLVRIRRPLVAGLLVALSLPPWGWWPLCFVGLAMYARVAVERRDDAPFATAFLFALGWFAPSMAWMWFLTAPGYLIAVALFAALHGGAAWLAVRLAGDSEPRHRAMLVVCHALAEALRLSWPFGGVPLATLAIAQSPGPLRWLAPLGGVILLGAVTMWLSFSSRRGRAVLVVAVLVLIGRFGGFTADTGTRLTVAMVQGGGEQGTHAIDTDPRVVFERHLAATRAIPSPGGSGEAADDIDLVVWPENVINISGSGLFEDSRERREIGAEAARLGVPFVVGITEDSGDGRFTNAQVVVNTRGEVVGRYDKVRRVPFGEYMPFRSQLSALGAPVHLVPRDARPGDARAWLDIPLADGTGTDVRASVAISWEVFFGGRVNEGVTDGAGIVVNPTNGSSYTWTILQTQQVAASRLRALEQGRWVVQVAPTGFSAFVSPRGVVHERTAISEQAVRTRTVELRDGRTPYSRLGNAPFIWGLVALALVGRRSRRTDS